MEAYFKPTIKEIKNMVPIIEESPMLDRGEINIRHLVAKSPNQTMSCFTGDSQELDPKDFQNVDDA
jgi:hypothetical protein